ncbi:hypothetical protein M4951_10065 [Blastopirellula sp. J2-11]|uniref:hypothetical protein n=1 Tax=Blastopirellula sp. J2-11 TaxID=2943192 RepID=UPI0021C96D66|nr:hypothetical protein [Blastopirellula sp. J2-11]UUO08642.1 hypothetical protein M4951_10065 [Blastopirellula sp. J2-11]
MSPHLSIRRLTCWLGLAVAVTFTLGCSRSSRIPGLIEVTGNVTFNGQPVSGGMIYFEPDVRAGNNGPQGFAEIIDGRYSTLKGGRGVKSGPNMVRIEEIQPIEGEKSRAMLFYEHHTEAVLTADNTEQDFEIPADTAKRKGRR